MGFVFRLEDYPKYLERVGGATYIDVTRRTDPARSQKVWDNLEAVIGEFGAPWVVQLWTKDLEGALARGALPLRDVLEAGTIVTVQLTVTGLAGSVWEPRNLAQPFAGVKELISLAGSADHIKWRYDPIIPTVHSLETFRRLSGQAAELGIRRCVINFVARPGRYKRVDARMGTALPGWSEGMPGYDEAWQVETASQVLEAAREQGLTVAVCAESAGLALFVPGLRMAACGEYGWFVELSGRDPRVAGGRGSRLGCGCAPYFDVGFYGLWRGCHQCLYCYAG